MGTNLRRLLLCCGAALLVGAGAAAATAAQYKTQFLGTRTLPRGINDLGAVVGTLRRTPDETNTDHPFVWAPATPNSDVGTLTELPMLPTSSGDGTALAINNLGQIVGSSATLASFRAVLWSPNGTDGYQITSLPNSSTSTSYYATGINDAGVVVGHSAHTAFVWTPTSPNGVSGVVRGVPTHATYTSAHAYAINESGQVAGTRFAPQPLNNTYRSFLWSPTDSPAGPATDFGLPDASTTDVVPLGMNDRGQVVGYVERNSFPRVQAFLWTPDSPNGYAGQFQLIEGMSYALDVNNSGVVVGYRESPGSVATVWTAATGVRDLNDLVPAGGGVDYDRAVAINESGQIAAWGTAYTAPNFVTHGYLLTVVPEPASVLLAAFGLIIVGGLRRTEMPPVKGGHASP